MASRLERELLGLVDLFTDQEGLNASVIPNVSFFKATHKNITLPLVYEPCLCIIVQGEKDVVLGKEIYRYGAMEFLVASVHLPIVGTVTRASLAKPYFVIQIDIDIQQMSELLVRMVRPATANRASECGLFIGKVDNAMLESVHRLVTLLQTPDDVPILAEHRLLEIYYRLLRSDYGNAIVQAALNGSSTQRVSIAIEKLRRDFCLPVAVEDLAKLAGMSVSSFHAHFKAVTNMSPLQFQKMIRLMEARQFMVANNAGAESAAYQVGYESPSQFSREYARMFGSPPGRDKSRLRQ
ncbi:AraC family transcriptional regulator [Simiduia curdlanivorans]|uniref:AraC family transcriptional regulator N-terminal domain-containing protein n=1 Tax=Simiduia curdlanivorans TaxID=1492769 RepID=A0ABV8V941_9GAMM|nr:AraC family transcriptional regulator [Simiduia curdlanivorans]MDN3639481.1 AraC family transcriptional regulator [Simiduia curdlanivorans]